MTILGAASAYAKQFKLFFSQIGAVVSYGLIDPISKNIVVSAADGNLTLNLPSGKALVGFTGALGSAIDFVQDTTPVTTATITANANGQNEIDYITPAGTIAALTFVFPTDAASRLGQSITLFSTQIVTALTITSAGLTLKGTALTAMAVNTPYVWKKVAAATWARIS